MLDSAGICLEGNEREVSDRKRSTGVADSREKFNTQLTSHGGTSVIESCDCFEWLSNFNMLRDEIAG